MKVKIDDGNDHDDDVDDCDGDDDDDTLSHSAPTFHLTHTNTHTQSDLRCNTLVLRGFCSWSRDEVSLSIV